MSPVQKVLFIALILAGISIWSYNGIMLIGSLPQTESIPADQQMPVARPLPLFTSVNDSMRTPYVGKFRDPFAPSIGRARPKPVAPKSRAPTQKRVVQAPRPNLALLGVFWDPKSPMAMVQGPDGQTENLRIGMKIAEATVTRINRNAITMRFGNKTFTLNMITTP